MTLLKLCTNQLHREMILYWRQRRVCVNSWIFFLMIVVFFPLTLPPNTKILSIIAPGLIWISMLLSLFLSSERLFQQESEDGVIEQWLVSGQPVSIFILSKIIVNWLINIVPMTLFFPVFAVLFNLNTHQTLNIILNLIAGTPAILALCALAAAFGSSVKNNGVLMAIIVLPLTLPIIVIGSSTDSSATIALLLAISITSLAILPMVIAQIISAVL